MSTLRTIAVLVGCISAAHALEIGPASVLKFKGRIVANATSKHLPLWTITDTPSAPTFARLSYVCRSGDDHRSPDPRGVYVGVSVRTDRDGELVMAPAPTAMYAWNERARTFYFIVHPYNDCGIAFHVWERGNGLTSP